MFFSDSILGQNDFLDVFGTSQEVSQEPFGGHLGYLLGQLLGWFSVAPEITNNKKNSMSCCLWALGKNKKYHVVVFFEYVSKAVNQMNTYLKKKNNMCVAFERYKHIDT